MTETHSLFTPGLLLKQLFGINAIRQQDLNLACSQAKERLLRRVTLPTLCSRCSRGQSTISLKFLVTDLYKNGFRSPRLEHIVVTPALPGTTPQVTRSFGGDAPQTTGSAPADCAPQPSPGKRARELSPSHRKRGSAAAGGLEQGPSQRAAIAHATLHWRKRMPTSDFCHCDIKSHVKNGQWSPHGHEGQELLFLIGPVTFKVVPENPGRKPATL